MLTCIVLITEVQTCKFLLILSTATNFSILYLGAAIYFTEEEKVTENIMQTIQLTLKTLIPVFVAIIFLLAMIISSRVYYVFELRNELYNKFCF